MDVSEVFAYCVLVLIIATILFVFLENKSNIHIPTFKEQLKKESNYRLFISFTIAFVIVLFFMILKKI